MPAKLKKRATAGSAKPAEKKKKRVRKSKVSIETTVARIKDYWGYGEKQTIQGREETANEMEARLASVTKSSDRSTVCLYAKLRKRYPTLEDLEAMIKSLELEKYNITPTHVLRLLGGHEDDWGALLKRVKEDDLRVTGTQKLVSAFTKERNRDKGPTNKSSKTGKANAKKPRRRRTVQTKAREWINLLREHVERGSRLMEDLLAQLEATKLAGVDAITAVELRDAIQHMKAAPDQVDKVAEKFFEFVARDNAGQSDG